MESRAKATAVPRSWVRASYMASADGQIRQKATGTGVSGVRRWAPESIDFSVKSKPIWRPQWSPALGAGVSMLEHATKGMGLLWPQRSPESAASCLMWRRGPVTSPQWSPALGAGVRTTHATRDRGG
jgi:hypothetical protein